MDTWEMPMIAISVLVIAIAVIVFFIALTVLIISLKRFSKKASKEAKKETDDLDDVVSALTKFFNPHSLNNTEGKIAGVLKGALLGMTLWQEFKRRK